MPSITIGMATFLHALPIYDELIEFNPGNLEATYAYAQDFCGIGLCKSSRKMYYHLLNLEPNHDLAKMALTRNYLRENSLLQGNYTFWTEKGSGQFANSQIMRQEWDEIYEWTPKCDTHLRFIQNEWLEYPFFKDKYYPAEGQGIEVDHVFNKYVKGVVGVARKNYFNRFPSRYTCIGTLWFDLNDYAYLGIGFERKNEVYNYFNLKQGTQAKISWVTLRTGTHSFTAAGTYRHLDYNDGNTLQHANVSVSYAFTEDPAIFKVILDANYRNSTHLTEIIFNSAGEVVNIIHPYWTPKNYYSGVMTFEFRYNYAWFTYCEAPQRFIDIKLTGEDDTAHNPSIQLVFEWKHEFFRHWGFSVIGLFHRSKLWNADGLWTQVYYRF